jgi:hypothetical protein
MPDLQDTACTACIKVDCCQALEDCYANATCQCLYECVDTQDPDLLGCLTQCDLDLNPPGFDGILTCAEGPCTQVCMFP